MNISPYVICPYINFLKVKPLYYTYSFYQLNSWFFAGKKFCQDPHSIEARILQWVATPFYRGSSQLRDRTLVSRTASSFFTLWVTREAPKSLVISKMQIKSKSNITIYLLKWMK